MKKGFAVLEIVLVVSLLAGGGLFFSQWKSKRAAQKSVDATSQLLAAQEKVGATVAASVVKIGEANAVAPVSPSRDFITREIPLAQSLLPAPDQQALIEAEKRKVAVMEGKVALAKELYEDAYARAAKLEKALEKAVEERKEVDQKFVEAAAAANARQSQLIGMGVIALVLAAGWVYARLHGLRFKGLLQKFVIPTLDKAYDEGDELVKKVLDTQVFDKLTDNMDAKDKKLVHAIRSES